MRLGSTHFFEAFGGGAQGAGLSGVACGNGMPNPPKAAADCEGATFKPARCVVRGGRDERAGTALNSLLINGTQCDHVAKSSKTAWTGGTPCRIAWNSGYPGRLSGARALEVARCPGSMTQQHYARPHFPDASRCGIDGTRHRTTSSGTAFWTRASEPRVQTGIPYAPWRPVRH